MSLITRISADSTDELVASLSCHTHRAFTAGRISQEYPIWDKNGRKYQDLAGAYLAHYQSVTSMRREEFCFRLYFKRFTLYPSLVEQIIKQGDIKWFSDKAIPDDELPGVSAYALRRKLMTAYSQAKEQPPHTFVL